MAGTPFDSELDEDDDIELFSTLADYLKGELGESESEATSILGKLKDQLDQLCDDTYKPGTTFNNVKMYETMANFLAAETNSNAETLRAFIEARLMKTPDVRNLASQQDGPLLQSPVPSPTPPEPEAKSSRPPL